MKLLCKVAQHRIAGEFRKFAMKGAISRYETVYIRTVFAQLDRIRKSL